MALTYCPVLVGAEFVFNDKVENRTWGLLPLIQSEDGQAGVGDDEGLLGRGGGLVPHRQCVDHHAGVALPDVVTLVHEHVILSPAVEIGQGVLVGVEADLENILVKNCRKYFSPLDKAVSLQRDTNSKLGHTKIFTSFSTHSP